MHILLITHVCSHVRSTSHINLPQIHTYPPPGSFIPPTDSRGLSRMIRNRNRKRGLVSGPLSRFLARRHLNASRDAISRSEVGRDSSETRACSLRRASEAAFKESARMFRRSRRNSAPRGNLSRSVISQTEAWGCKRGDRGLAKPARWLQIGCGTKP